MIWLNLSFLDGRGVCEGLWILLLLEKGRLIVLLTVTTKGLVYGFADAVV